MNQCERFRRAKILIEKQQLDFIHLLLEGNYLIDKLDQRGIEIYRKNIQMTAKNALAISYPTVIKLIGDDMFFYVSNKLLLQYPPQDGDWATWGIQFPHLLNNVSQLESYPYIADSAQLDQIRHMIDRAEDFEYNAASIALLSTASLDNIFVKFPETVHIFHSNYPVIEIWNANHSVDSQECIQQFKRRVDDEMDQQYVLIYRNEYTVHMKELETHEYQWFQYLMNGFSIGQSLDKLNNEKFHFEHWLPDAIQHHLIKGLALKK